MRRGLLIIALLLGVAALDEWGMRWLMAPWSYPQLGPTLTGTWEGPLRARLGADFRLLVELAYAPGPRRRPWDSNLTGRAVICTRHGALYEYGVSGDADRDGQNLVLSLRYDDPSQSALDLGLVGSWSGAQIALAARKNPFSPDGRFELGRPTSSSDPDDSFAPTELRPTDRPSFLVACGRLTR